MGKHRRRSWIQGHGDLVEDHYTHMQSRRMSDTSKLMENGHPNGETHSGPNEQKSNGTSSNLFQISTYFPIVQHSPATTLASPSNGTSVINANGLSKSTPKTKKKTLTSKTVFQDVLDYCGVSFYIFGFVFAPFLFTLLGITILFFPPFWFIAIGYFCWYIYDYSTPKNGSRPCLWYRQLSVWTWMANYFPVRLIKTAELPADRNYIVGAHPHGILSFGTYLTFCTEAVGFADLFPGLQRRYAVTLPVQYWFPIRRELLMLSNTISSEASAIEHVLKENDHGTVVAIVPGGASEALDSSSNNFKLTLKNRKGFIKLALKHGASLVPMYTFGETSTYKQLPNPEGSRLRRFQSSLKSRIGVTMPFFYGSFGLLPFRVPLHTVIGQPIFVQKTKEPTINQVSSLHKKYCHALSSLFDEHKQKYGISPSAKLEFV